jgi:hypothetical protein
MQKPIGGAKAAVELCVLRIVRRIPHLNKGKES